eukprot:360216-Pelagomonas_calceolata.AAC.6
MPVSNDVLTQHSALQSAFGRKWSRSGGGAVEVPQGWGPPPSVKPVGAMLPATPPCTRFMHLARQHVVAESCLACPRLQTFWSPGVQGMSACAPGLNCSKPGFSAGMHQGLTCSIHAHTPSYTLPSSSNSDTPGVHLHHRVPHMLTPEQLRLLHPRKRLAPILPPTPKELAASEAPELAESGKRDLSLGPYPSVAC